MIKTALLYSGGKDSSLVAHLLGMLNYDITLVTANFGLVPDSPKTAADAAKFLNLPHEVMEMPSEQVAKAVDIAKEDGYVLNGINYLHMEVVRAAAEKYGKERPMIADGTRRDDRTPKLAYEFIRSIEDKYNIEYFAPLNGISYKTINYLTEKLFKTENVKAGVIPTSEYETEIREEIRRRGEKTLAEKIFPREHYHSIVIEYNGKE